MHYEFIQLPFGDFGAYGGSGDSGDFSGDCGDFSGDCGGGDCCDLAGECGFGECGGDCAVSSFNMKFDPGRAVLPRNRSPNFIVRTDMCVK